ELEHPLERGELIVAIELPSLPLARKSLYLKFRDRQSYEFALVSVAVALDGVGTKPWRARQAEAELIGERATPQQFAIAAVAELEAADVHEHNAFKVELAQRAIVRALTTAMNGGAQ